ncbi:MAG: adenosylcobinamide-phosphate guanylyltransferase [Pyrococcus sp.]|nr:adenosylcobinamide-phosphate guanylyltransferase [Pyrococcus sp.]
MGREKPVLKIAGKEMLLWIYEQAETVGEVLVALSKHTPRTRELCLREGIEFLETPGRGYVEDVQWLIRELGPFVSLSSDVPFVKASDVYSLLKEFDGKVSLTGVLPLEIVPKDLTPYSYMGYAIVGINGVAPGGERFFVFSNPLLALNVNTPRELELAERIAKIIKGRGIR